MGTIGELEQQAGIASSAEACTEFWRQFHHLQGRACLDAGVAELKWMIAERDGSAGPAGRTKGQPPLHLDAEQVAALQAYAARHGRRWKSTLNHVWMGGAPYDDTGSFAVSETPMVQAGFTVTDCPRPSRRLSTSEAKAILAGRCRPDVAQGRGWPFSFSITMALNPVTVCPSVLLRSEPASVRFKAALRAAWRPDPVILRRADPLDHRRAQAPLARRSAPLVLAVPGP